MTGKEYTSILVTLTITKWYISEAENFAALHMLPHNLNQVKYKTQNIPDYPCYNYTVCQQLKYFTVTSTCIHAKSLFSI